MLKFYIASKLENVEQVRQVKEVLEGWGWSHTYDWTVHGSVQREGHARIAEVAANETEGVYMSDVVIVLLPGGRGTHCELGMAVVLSDCFALQAGEKPAPAIYIVGTDDDFDARNGNTCAFYHHPNVVRCLSVHDLIVKLGGLS